MYRKFIFIQLLLILFSGIIPGQVRVRIYADQKPSSAVFTVTQGKYELDIYDGKSLPLTINDPVILALYEGRIAVKTRTSKSFMCDSLIMKGLTGNDRFSFRINGTPQNMQKNYGGDLQCSHDLGIMVFINNCDFELYIAGVVRAEGGPGKNIEYLKSQALLTRTFMYKHFSRHLIDRYNLCDNTHCQAFNGISADTLINRAALESRGLVVLDRDSILIISAFHSNCGGETSTSQDVWLSGYLYLTKVTDPYCIKSPGATWRKSIPYSDWEAYLKKSGFEAAGSTSPSYNFQQITRQDAYTIGSFSLPFRQIRNDLNLRSTFFSVMNDGDSITFIGRGYGHGVGLCQEGAMVMAAKGFKFSDIIGFYYSDVIITDISNARIIESDF